MVYRATFELHEDAFKPPTPTAGEGPNAERVRLAKRLFLEMRRAYGDDFLKRNWRLIHWYSGKMWNLTERSGSHSQAGESSLLGAFFLLRSSP